LTRSSTAFTRLRTLGVAAALFGLATLFPATSSASGRPKLLSHIRCAHPCSRLLGIYEVRPRHIALIDAYGGDLTVRWNHWTRRAAAGKGHGYFVGAGASYRYPVRVRAYRVRSGKFTRLEVISRHKGLTTHEHLHLARQSGDPLWKP
jgi:hypothetical protein